MSIFLLSDLKHCFQESYNIFYDYINRNKSIFVIDYDLKFDPEPYKKINHIFDLDSKKVSLDFFRNYNFEKFNLVKNLIIVKKFKDNSHRIHCLDSFKRFLISENLLLDNDTYYSDHEIKTSELLKNSLNNVIKDNMVLKTFVNKYCDNFKMLDFFIQDILVCDYFCNMIPFLNIYKIDSDFDLDQFLLYCRLNSVFFNVVKRDELEYSLISHLLKFNNDMLLFLNMLKNNVFLFGDSERYRNIVCCKSNNIDLVALNIKYNLPVNFLDFYKVYFNLKNRPARLPIELLYYFVFSNNLVSEI